MSVMLFVNPEVPIAGPNGTRRVALSDFIVDAYTTQLEPAEMVTGLRVAIPSAASGGAYAKFEKRAGDFAVASVGVQVTLEGERCGSVAVSLGALGARPIRATEAEQRLRNSVLSDDALRDAQDLVCAAAQPFADTRGSVEYKRHLAGVVFRRAFAVALDRARGIERETIHL